MVVHASRRSIAHLSMRRVPKAARTSELLRACAWCERIAVGGCWIAPDVAIQQLRTYEWSEPPRFTHGACDTCLENLLRRRELSIGGALATNESVAR